MSGGSGDGTSSDDGEIRGRRNGFIDCDEPVDA